MTFDSEGHIMLCPAEVDSLVRRNIPELIDHWLLPGTPAAFTYDQYRGLLRYVAQAIQVHPASIVVRGSAKLGFSITPKEDRVWVKFGPESDVDLAIVDLDHYHFLDSQVRRFDRMRFQLHGKDFKDSLNRQKYRAHYCYRYMDLPGIEPVRKYAIAMAAVSGALNPERGIIAFFYRDWWAVYSRYESDLRRLQAGLINGTLPRRENLPRPRIV